MKTTTITCDFCGSDLSTPSPMPGYYLTLSEASKPTGPFVFSAHVEPQLPHDMHFCSLGCLKRKMENGISNER